MQQIARIFLGAAGWLACALNPAQADMGFRNDGSGIFPDARPPLQWSATSNVVWTIRLKSSNASPVVLGDKVIACEEPDVLLALDFSDGRRLWATTNSYFDVLPPAEAETARTNQKLAEPLIQTLRDAENNLRAAEKLAKAQTNAVDARASLDAARREVAALHQQLNPLQKYKLPDTHGVNGYTTPTPVTDGRNVYAVFCSGVVAAFSPDGQRLWARVLPVRPHNASWGHSASPRLADGLLLVHFGNRLFAIDARTGMDKWTAEAGSGFGSPFVDKVDGAATVMTPGGDFFTVADGRLYVSCDNGKTVVIKTGRAYEELARNRLPEFRSSPVFVGDSLLVRTTTGLLRIASPK